MNNQNDQTHPTVAIGQNITNLLTIAIDGVALSIEVFLHRHFGARYVGLQGLFGMAFIAVYTVWWGEHGHDPRPMILFLAAYLFLIASARLDGFRRAMRGDATHSRYSGTPWIMGRNTRLSEITIKRFIEPAAVLCIAGLIKDYNLPLAFYLVIAVVCLAATNMRAAMWMQGRVMDMNDAIAEQEQVADRFRQHRNDNF